MPGVGVGGFKGIFNEKRFASSGNRTRAARVAGEHSTTEPTMLVRIHEGLEPQDGECMFDI